MFNFWLLYYKNRLLIKRRSKLTVTVSTLLSELGRPDYLSHFPKLETACSSHLSLTCLFFYINTLVGCASIGLNSEGAVTKCVLEPVRIPPL